MFVQLDGNTNTFCDGDHVEGGHDHAVKGVVTQGIGPMLLPDQVEVRVSWNDGTEEKSESPRPMTGDALREIAAWFDTYDAMAESFLNLLVQSGRAEEAETVGARHAAAGKEVQDDLRRWAAEVDG
jgi:hypothetical protein